MHAGTHIIFSIHKGMDMFAIIGSDMLQLILEYTSPHDLAKLEEVRHKSREYVLSNTFCLFSFPQQSTFCKSNPLPRSTRILIARWKDAQLRVRANVVYPSPLSAGLVHARRCGCTGNACFPHAFVYPLSYSIPR